MAFLLFDQSRLHIELRVGILEEFKNEPEKMKDVNSKITDLKSVLKNKMIEISGNKDIDIPEFEKILNSENEKKQQWDDFLTKEYTPKLKIIVENVDEINKKICPGYTGL